MNQIKIEESNLKKRKSWKELIKNERKMGILKEKNEIKKKIWKEKWMKNMKE